MKNKRTLSMIGISVEEAADALGLGRSAAYAAVKRGDLPAIRVGGRWIVSVAGLEELLGLHGDLSGTSRG
jgi:excisionase family DNA binding protein